jgi:hypothetical protein
MRLTRTVVVLGFSAYCAVAARAQAPARSLLRGTVVDDANEKPIAGATVSLDALKLQVVTDSAGNFRIPTIPLGRYVVSIKRLGYGALSAIVTFSGSDTLEYDFALVKQATALPEVAVTTPARVPPKLIEFEQRRQLGFGRFLTDSVLTKNVNRRLSEILGQVPGTRIVRGPGSNGWLANPVGYTSGVKFELSPMDVNRGADPNQCYAAVMLDGNRIFSGHPGELLFDLNSLSTNSIAGIEFYRDAATIPAKFNQTSGKTCGLIVIWTK